MLRDLFMREAESRGSSSEDTAMGTSMAMSHSPLWRGMRWVVWGGAALLLLLPLVAMRFTAEVDWTGADFLVMGTMLALVGAAFEVAVRVARSHAYVVATGVAVAAAFLMTWSNLAVGIIGDEGHPANLIFFGVLAIGLASVLFARLKPLGMARAMEATAVAQGAACIAALALDGVYVFALTLVFLAMWLVSAQLFRKAAREEADVGGIAEQG
jgi:hypothetical protein